MLIAAYCLATLWSAFWAWDCYVEHVQHESGEVEYDFVYWVCVFVLSLSLIAGVWKLWQLITKGSN